MDNSSNIANDPRSWLQRGLAAAHAGDQSEARRCFETAREIDPDNITALLWLAWLSPTRRESLALFCRVLELDPENKRAQAGIEWVRNRREDDLGSTTRRAVLQAPLAAAGVQPRMIPPDSTTRRVVLQAPLAAERTDSIRELVNRMAGLRLVANRVANILVVLAVIVLLTFFGLIVAERGRQRVPAAPLSAAVEAISSAITYVADHPATYTWHRVETPAFSLVATTVGRSGGLLLLALALAALLGVPLGVAAALARRERGAPLVLLLSILGVSTPSFLLAMLLGVLNIQMHRRLGMAALPPHGFGWDLHLVMPALVLAARPLAQIVQITYVSMSDILGQDYIRAAHAKGLHHAVVLTRHALRNALVPILTTLGTSLRFSLASLPVVEFFFLWPGVGFTLLEAIERGMAPLVADLIVALGLLFLVVNLALDLLYPRLDPRLADSAQRVGRQAPPTWRERVEEALDSLTAWWSGLRCRPRGETVDAQESFPSFSPTMQANGDHFESIPPSTPHSNLGRPRKTFGNPTLLVGMLLVLALFGLVFFGERLTPVSPYQTHGVMTIDGEIGIPPFPPSTVFPWGSDPLGRDVQSLVLNGARQTLSLALFAMAARMAVGTALGLLSGWWQHGRFDRFISSAVGVWAAFPVTLFAIIVIQALGIQKGMSVFIIALCVVGWAEIAQLVRGQVISIKPSLHIEAARAIGARTSHILACHVLPLLLPSLLVLAVLEMGGVLLLLAELGFLNIFLGGGFKVQIAEMGRMVPVIAFYSDVPEWGALLANIREWWRAYPWLAWYPGIFFFLAILAFNLWGEGLRRWLDQTRFNVSRLFNRYSLAAVVALVFGLVWMLRSAAPLGVYSSQAREFEVRRAMEDIETLASPEFQGRETGTPGARLAAEYIAGRMKEIGLQPAGQGDTFIQTFPCPRPHLNEMPRLEILDAGGNIVETLAYRQDFAEYIGLLPGTGEAEAAVMGLRIGPDTGPNQVTYQLAELDAADRVILVRESELEQINPRGTAGTLVIPDDPAAIRRKYLFHRDAYYDTRGRQRPIMLITEALAGRLLATAGSSLAEFDRLGDGLQPGEIRVTGAGETVRMAVIAIQTEDIRSEECYNIIGFIPGTGAQMVSSTGRSLNSQVIMVHAHYDGLGVGPDGTLYAGANDNASGVAAMLEMARVLNHGPYQPDKTVVFVAWTGGERAEIMRTRDVMNAKLGFSKLTVEATIELNGLGAGEGKAIALGDRSSYRLVQLFQGAASRMGASITTRGRGPHYGLYSLAIPGATQESALPIDVSWDGSDRLAHTAEDTVDIIDAEKLETAGETTLLVLTVLSREVDW